MKHLKPHNEEFFFKKLSKWYETRRFCSRYNINNYKVNEDGSIDVDGNVTLVSIKEDTIPVKFGRVTGDFQIHKCDITSLKNCPYHVGGQFYAMENKLLTSLVGGPKYVKLGYNCPKNALTSLEGSPEIVNGDMFNCSSNKLTSLVGGPKIVNGTYNFSQNKVETFEGLGDFQFLHCVDNPIHSLHMFIAMRPRRNSLKYDKIIELLNDYDAIRGRDIILERINEFLDEIGCRPITSPEVNNAWRSNHELQEMLKYYKLI